MFILISTVMFMSFMRKNVKRDVYTYCFIQNIYCELLIRAYYIYLFMLYIPTILVLIIEKNMFKVDIGFSYLQYSF